MKKREEEFATEGALKDTHLKQVIHDYEEKLSEIQEKSTVSSENLETPRVVMLN